ncbi:hypothetical protein C2869_04780 [Saccharobesus litoralis]|uniref:AAA domain-containing protein n=1 Tax=Saccharobesus litoralis TaxID=2172099 RepID=A0A2S0VNK4_9ALTE|nr:ParA family protein [Saccharobesus litoralis]AWB65794.1 hypothetical protein C2869_04780 [Saccharobesus litoralis]
MATDKQADKTADKLRTWSARAKKVAAARRQHYLEDRTEKRVRTFRTFNKTEAGQWLGYRYTTQFTRDFEEHCQDIDIQRSDNKNFAFTLENLHQIADRLSIPAFERTDEEQLQVIAFANLKGGVGKTTASIHSAIGLATCNNRRYRIGFIDCDPQGSATIYGPDANNQDDFTVGDLLSENYELDDGETNEEFVYSCFQDTHIPNLKFLPAKIDDFMFEQYAEEMQFSSDDQYCAYRLLKERIIDVVEDKFDIIVIDTPPSFNKVFLNSLYASTAIVIPFAPDFLAYDSTLKYVERLQSIYMTLKRAGHQGFDMERFLITNFDAASAARSKGQATQQRLVNEFRSVFGADTFSSVINNTPAIPTCSEMLASIFDLRQSDYPRTTKQLVQGLENMKAYVNELEQQILLNWTNNQELDI